jgi:adenine-specific DNA-methyltransferase
MTALQGHENRGSERLGAYVRPERRPDLATVRYIGSKTRVVDEIMDILGRPHEGDGMFVDAFCGTGVVGAGAADLGWAVRVNDQMRSAVAVATARLLSLADAPFDTLGGYEAVIGALNAAPPVKGFFWREYSPASVGGRMYFTEQNAKQIDAARALISRWHSESAISRAERELLVADLIGATGRVANIAGTYGCFLTHWSGASQKPFCAEVRELRSEPVVHQVFCRDVVDVPIAVNDVAYFDPPYTKRQYAAYYHINETLAHGDEPEVTGKTGLRHWQEQASDYCYKVRALRALTDLITNTSARRTLLSYSSEGHVALDELSAALDPLGELTVHKLGPIGRYRPNRIASGAGNQVVEYVIELRKTAVGEPEAVLA